MSASLTLGFLALVGAAAAVPHYSAHSKFHHRPSGTGGYAGPTGGWGNNGNDTRPAAPTGSGAVPGNSQTTFLDETSTSTTTVFMTVYPSPVSSGAGAASSVAAADVSGGASVCGPATVTVTATNKVTVTVPAGGAPSSSASSAAAPQVSSSAPVASVPSASESFVIASSLVPEQLGVKQPSASAPAASQEAVQTSAAPIATSSAAPQSSTPASSAAPSSSAPSSPGYSGGKRGLAYREEDHGIAATWADKNLGFAWNWESDPRGDIGINFIPTLRTANSANTHNWAENVDAAVKNGTKVVFGLNEPDKSNQANLSPGDACTAWVTYMNPIAAKHPDIHIAGPSFSSSETKGEGLSWFSTFEETCKDAVYHSVNAHWYGGPTDTFQKFKTYIDKVIATTGKSVWVTEFALEGASAEQSAEFLKQAQEYLDGNDKCLGYSYFAAGVFSPAYNLLGYGNALTETGKVYVS